MSGFRIEFDAEALARWSYQHLPWWQRAWIRIVGKERVIARAVKNMTKEEHR